MLQNVSQESSGTFPGLSCVLQLPQGMLEAVPTSVWQMKETLKGDFKENVLASEMRTQIQDPFLFRVSHGLRKRRSDNQRAKQVLLLACQRH